MSELAEDYEKCPICEEYKAIRKVGTMQMEYKGFVGTLKVMYLECDLCGSESATPDQVRENAETSKSFKRKVIKLIDTY